MGVDMAEKREIVAAIQYNEEKDHAPRVVAQGKGEIAEKIKSVAQAHDIPTYKDEKLAEQLYNLSIGDEIPAELYHVVAEILAFIITLDTKE